MELKINGEPIDITLENEKNLHDLLESLRRELFQDKQQIMLLKINGQKQAVDDIPDILIEELAVVEIETVSSQQMLLDSLIEASNYLGRSLEFLRQFGSWQEVDQKQRSHFQEGLAWLKEMYEIVERQGTGQDAAKNDAQNRNGGSPQGGLADSMQHIQTNIWPNLETEENFRFLLDILNQHKQIIDQKINILQASHLTDSDILQRLQVFIEKIPALQDILSQVGPLLQEGKDSDAYMKVQAAMDDMQVYLSILPTLEQSGMGQNVSIGGDEISTWQELNAQILEYLDMLAEAMEENDSVSISDICDYELPEALELIPQAATQLRSQHN